VNPKYVLLLGRTAVKTTIGAYALTLFRGKKVKVGNRFYIPTYYPANAMRNRSRRKLFMQDLIKLSALV
jgi:uracil-DNA glycosylase